jgi:hypothetical protein
MEAVVVLPWVPATASTHLSAAGPFLRAWGPSSAAGPLSGTTPAPRSTFSASHWGPEI